jgi:metallo-beta-lactamase class B
MFRSLTIVAVMLGACAHQAPVGPNSWLRSNPHWIEPTAPYRIVGDVYYVGTKGIAAYYVGGAESGVLIDGGPSEAAPLIIANLSALGFDIARVKYLLNTHAHFDHSGGLAALKEASGAQMVSSEGDLRALESGRSPGDGPSFDAPPVKVDRVIADGETVELGGATLTARLTPGHTQGCTSWTLRAEDVDILFFCSATVAANRLVSIDGKSENYPGIIDAYRATFAKTRDWRPDVFLPNHPEFNDLAARRERQLKGEADAFIDPEAFPAHRALLAAAFESELARQMEAQKGGE